MTRDLTMSPAPLRTRTPRRRTRGRAGRPLYPARSARTIATAGPPREPSAVMSPGLRSRSRLDICMTIRDGFRIGHHVRRPRSRDEIGELSRLHAAANLERDPATRAHRPPPQGVSVRVADGDVHVRPAADPRCDVVDPEPEGFVHGGLEGERPDDPGGEVLPGRADVRLRDLEDVLEARLPEGRAVVTDDDVLRPLLPLEEGLLLERGKAHVAVQRGLEAPVDPQELEPIPVRLDRRVKEVEVEDRPEEVPLDPRGLEVLPRDHALLEERLGLL